MTRMNRLFLIFGALVLFGALLVVAFWSKDVKPGKPPHLAQALPAALRDWESKEVPLGETEAVQGAVEQTLKFDDVFFREYRSAAGVFSVYVAYWRPAKMPVQVVASHTPDRCWSGAGWSCTLMQHNRPLGGAAAALRPGERRIFETGNSARLHVQYWHLVGDALYDYGERFNQVPSVWRWWRDAAQQIFRAPDEQYFIRISADRPFEQLEGDPGWQEVLAALGKLGLAAPPQAPAS